MGEASARNRNEASKADLVAALKDGVALPRHFLRRTDDRAAYKRVKTFFARGESGSRAARTAPVERTTPVVCLPSRATELPPMQQTQNLVFCS